MQSGNPAGWPQQTGTGISHGLPAPEAGWYLDPWRLGPLRWWDGSRWSPYVDLLPPPPPAPPEGPGIAGGGIAAVGVGIALTAGLIVQVALLIGGWTQATLLEPWVILLLELPLWAGFIGSGLCGLTAARNRQSRRGLRVRVA